VVSRGGRNTFLGCGGCVVIVSSREEGPGASAPIGQASAVYGATCPGLIYLGGRSRSRGITYLSEQLGARLCHESIYQAVYQPHSRLIRPPQVRSPHRGPLRTGRNHRRAHQRPGRRRPRFAQPMLSIGRRICISISLNLAVGAPWWTLGRGHCGTSAGSGRRWAPFTGPTART
jgi:hypothetical protein